MVQVRSSTSFTVTVHSTVTSDLASVDVEIGMSRGTRSHEKHASSTKDEGKPLTFSGKQTLSAYGMTWRIPLQTRSR